MARVLLILPTSTYRAKEFLAAAARLEVEVVTASEQAQALAGVMGERFLELPVDDPEAAASAIVEFAARVPLDGVVAVDDRGGLAAALAAERLGLRANPPATVAATTDKSLLRALLAKGGVRQPPFALLTAGPSRRQQLAAALELLGLPVVLKPLSLSGSRGVIRADSELEAVAAAARIERILEGCERSTEAILLEEYIPGAEVALEGIVRDGALETLCLFDKPDPLEGPFFEETIYVTPSRLAAGLQCEVRELVASGCAALGLREGPVHGEVRLRPTSSGSEPVLIEIAARTIGGRCSKALEFATGERLEELVLKHALGEGGASSHQLAGAAGVMMLPIPASGRLLSVKGSEQALAVAHISGLEIAIAPGRPIHALPEGDRYLGFLFATGPEPATVEAALRAAHAALEVEIATDRAGSAPGR